MLEIINGEFGLAFAVVIFAHEIASLGPRFNLNALGGCSSEFAPNIRAEFPDLWRRILGRLDADCKRQAEAMVLLASHTAHSG
jgi:hypothetical protein